MTGRHSGIFIGLFLISMSILLLQIEDKIRQPEIVLYFVSAVLTIGVAFILFSLIKRRDRDHQEN